MVKIFQYRLSILAVLCQQKNEISRMNLAKAVDLTERQTRSHLDVLRQQGIIQVSRKGIKITYHGQFIFRNFHHYLNKTEYHSMSDKEKALKEKLGIHHCIVIKGDADFDDSVYNVMGEVVEDLLIKNLPLGQNYIAVTGGSTLAKISQSFTSKLSQNHQLTFLPSRGGLGGDVAIQSNSVASQMANRTQGSYIPLFIPEIVEEDTREVLMKDQGISQVVGLSQQSDALIFSVGTAEVMAERRELDPLQIEAISKNKAVGEAFGVFFDLDGQVVVQYPRIGLNIQDLVKIPLLLTVVGGSSKAKAVEGFFQLSPRHGWLVCDDGIAHSILNGETL